jgi:RNA polymerase sigma factor (sigma-70 family)
MHAQPQHQSPRYSEPAAILEELSARHGPKLRAQAFRHAPDPEAAEDAFQDAAVEFLRYYKGSPGDDALRYMLHCIRQRARSAQRQLNHSAVIAAEVPEDVAVRLTRHDRLDPALMAERRQTDAERRDALRRLPAKHRTALSLFAAGYSYREISELRGWPYGTVSRCIAEGRAALKATAPR